VSRFEIPGSKALFSYAAMKQGDKPTLALCAPFHHAIELIGRRWTGAIISLLLQSRCRFATLRDAIPEITDRMLSERLQELESEGILERTVIPDTPVRVEYSLTKKGRALAAAVEAISEWAHKWGTTGAKEGPHKSERTRQRS
jgi:DNA-binding HxlR family transcriptional regulator